MAIALDVQFSCRINLGHPIQQHLGFVPTTPHRFGRAILVQICLEAPHSMTSWVRRCSLSTLMKCSHAKLAGIETLYLSELGEMSTWTSKPLLLSPGPSWKAC